MGCRYTLLLSTQASLFLHPGHDERKQTSHRVASPGPALYDPGFRVRIRICFVAET